MNFWWVNHSQTFRHEFFGKYIWSPKRKQNNQINPFYETMREVTPGDIIYSFASGAIQGFGVLRERMATLRRAPLNLDRPAWLGTKSVGAWMLTSKKSPNQ